MAARAPKMLMSMWPTFCDGGRTALAAPSAQLGTEARHRICKTRATSYLEFVERLRSEDRALCLAAALERWSASVKICNHRRGVLV